MWGDDAPMGLGVLWVAVLVTGMRKAVRREGSARGESSCFQGGECEVLMEYPRGESLEGVKELEHGGCPGPHSRVPRLRPRKAVWETGGGRGRSYRDQKGLSGSQPGGLALGAW